MTTETERKSFELLEDECLSLLDEPDFNILYACQLTYHYWSTAMDDIRTMDADCTNGGNCLCASFRETEMNLVNQMTEVFIDSIASRCVQIQASSTTISTEVMSTLRWIQANREASQNAGRVRLTEPAKTGE